MLNSLNRRELLAAAGASLAGSFCAGRGERFAVLTFDDAVKSHRSFVAPYLRELGFQATFLVTHRWMEDTESFMSWQDIAEIHQMVVVEPKTQRAHERALHDGERYSFRPVGARQILVDGGGVEASGVGGNDVIAADEFEV